MSGAEGERLERRVAGWRGGDEERVTERVRDGEGGGTHEERGHDPVGGRELVDAEGGRQREHDVEQDQEAGRFHRRPAQRAGDVEAGLDRGLALWVVVEEPLCDGDLGWLSVVGWGGGGRIGGEIPGGRTEIAMLEAPSVPEKGAASFLSAPWLWVRVAVCVVVADAGLNSLVTSYYGSRNSSDVRAVVVIDQWNWCSVSSNSGCPLPTNVT